MLSMFIIIWIMPTSYAFSTVCKSWFHRKFIETEQRWLSSNKGNYESNTLYCSMWYLKMNGFQGTEWLVEILDNSIWFYMDLDGVDPFSFFQFIITKVCASYHSIIGSFFLIEHIYVVTYLYQHFLHYVLQKSPGNQLWAIIENWNLLL